MSDLPAAELHEIADGVGDLLKGRVPSLATQVADSRGADIRWIIDQPPACLVSVPGEKKSTEDRQPLGNAGIYLVTIELLFCFDGMRPRDDEREYGWDIIAVARKALWGHRLPGTIMKIDYINSEEIGYDEDLRMTFFRQWYRTKVERFISEQDWPPEWGEYQESGGY